MTRFYRYALPLLLLVLLPLSSQAAAPAPCRAWPEWQQFRDHFMDPGGRIVDRAAADRRSTSEGQAYGLFFALVAHDRKAFERILEWTEDNLAQGDLTARLPAWLWGHDGKGAWQVLDANSASDADVWLAYTLAEAGRLWQMPAYSALAELLAARILREESAVLDPYGPALLPGPQGFSPAAGQYRLNPSYLPLPVLQGLATLYPDSDWAALARGSLALLHDSSPHGFAPDWVLHTDGKALRPDPEHGATGSYDAIRVYLWAGMLPDSDARRTELLAHFDAMAQHLARHGTPPLKTDSQRGTAEGVGPTGFSAALLPLLAARSDTELLRQQKLRLAARDPQARTDNYYDQVLLLFSSGWMTQRYRFDASGRLLPERGCKAH